MSTLTVTNLRPLKAYTMPRGPIDCVAMSGDLVAYSANGHTVIFDISAQKAHAFISPEIPPNVVLRARPRIASLAWCPSRPTEIAWLQVHDRNIRVTDVYRLRESVATVRVPNRVSRGECLKYSPDGNRLAALVDDHTVAVYEIIDHTQATAVDGGIGTLLSLSWLRNDIIMLAHNDIHQGRLRFCEFAISPKPWQSPLLATSNFVIPGRHAITFWSAYLLNDRIRANGTAADVTQSAGIKRAVYYDPSRKLFQVNILGTHATFDIEDTAMRRCDYSPPLSFFDNGRAIVMSRSSQILVYDLHRNMTSQVLSDRDEDAMVAIDQSRRRLVVIRRNQGWWSEDPDDVVDHHVVLASVGHLLFPMKEQAMIDILLSSGSVYVISCDGVNDVRLTGYLVSLFDATAPISVPPAHILTALTPPPGATSSGLPHRTSVSVDNSRVLNRKPSADEWVTDSEGGRNTPTQNRLKRRPGSSQSSEDSQPLKKYKPSNVLRSESSVNQATEPLYDEGGSTQDICAPGSEAATSRDSRQRTPTAQVQTRHDGMKVVVREAGRPGFQAELGSTLIVYYELYIGGEVVSAVTETPATITVGKGEIVPGIDEGLLKMSIGETRRISIPSPMGGDKADDIVLAAVTSLRATVLYGSLPT
ncbi:hypothetical protein FB107DRAFT_252260 [Schizophyllum commune]